RDFHVTGVQTCALPIWACGRRIGQVGFVLCLAVGAGRCGAAAGLLALALALAVTGGLAGLLALAAALLRLRLLGDPRPVGHVHKIGRASCRERVQSTTR